MDGWARLGSAFAGGGLQRDVAYNKGASQSLQLQQALLEARQKRDAEIGRQAAAKQAFDSGDNELGNAILQGFGTLAGLNTYAGGRQERGFKTDAMDLARQPNADVGELNRMLMVMSGKPYDPIQVEGNMVTSRIDPNIEPQTTELGRAMMASEFASAGAANARAAASYASAAGTRGGGGGGSGRPQDWSIQSTPQGMVRVNRFTGEVAPLTMPNGTAVMPKPTARGGGAMPAAGLKLQQEEIDAINAAENVTSSLQTIQDNLAGGELDLGPIDNLSSQFLNATGMSTPNSRNYASMMATLEKARNDSLRLNKGVQTEGDAQRAWNELIANVRDPDLVRQRIDEINALNQRAIKQRRMNVDLIRQNFGAGPVDLMDAFGGAPTQSAPIAAPAAPSAGPLGMGYEVGEVITVGGRQYRVVGGDPSDPELEEL